MEVEIYYICLFQ